MAFSGGVFSRLYSWVTDASNGVKIRSDKMDAEMDGFATGLSTAILKDGTQTVTANIPFAGYKLTGIGAATANGDALRFEQAGSLKDEIAKTDDYTMTTAESGKVVTFSKSTAVTATLPAVASNAGEVYRLRNIGTGNLVIDGNSSEQIEGATTLSLKTGDFAVVWANAGKTAWRAAVVEATADRYVAVDASQSFTAAEKQQGRENIGAIGNLHKVTYITSSGTHNYDSETKTAEIEVIGGGGGGGGSVASGGASGASAGSGGGAGGRTFRFLDIAGNAITSATATIGAGGGGSTGAGGTTGGTTSLADGASTTLSASGGLGGAVGSTSDTQYVAIGGQGGSASGGTLVIQGDTGHPSYASGTTSTVSVLIAVGGIGGSTNYSAGGRGQVLRTASSTSGAGVGAVGYGGGGGGAATTGTGSAAAGGNGAPGLIIIKEYK